MSRASSRVMAAGGGSIPPDGAHGARAYPLDRVARSPDCIQGAEARRSVLLTEHGAESVDAGRPSLPNVLGVA